MPAPHQLLHLTHPDAHVPRYELPDNVARPLAPWQLVAGFMLAAVAACGAFEIEEASHGVADADVSAAWMTPFALLLLAIAGMPFVARHWWERFYPHAALALGGLVAGYYGFFVDDGPGNIGRAVGDYISFVFLLASLYVVSGGILIRVRARATPLANLALLFVGVLLGNVLGTTAASVLLIRPFLRLNSAHWRPYYVAFFLFTVSNAGGALTPVGPPLFLGFLQGVPFWWIAGHCWPIWLTVNGLLLGVFFAVDMLASRRVPRPANDTDGPVFSIYGASNLLLAGLIVAGILLHARLNAWSHTHLGIELPWRELLMAVAAFTSLATTPARIHGENHFNYAPIAEVAFLFAGIFLTLVPALNYLAHHAAALPLATPGRNFFACGTLSSVLDNAPTYLTFLKAALATRTDGLAGLLTDPAGARRLVGVSMGAVLFGGMTYIGNGPNFMVRSIAEHSGAATPGFFSYVFRYAVPVLVPVLILVWAVFLR